MDYVRKSRTSLFLAALCSAVLAGFLYLYIYIYIVHIRVSENYISNVIGFIGVIFFATIPIVGIYKYVLHGRPAQKILSIGESGIQIHSGASYALSWHEIESIGRESVGRGKGKALSIYLKSDESKPSEKKRKITLLYFPDKKFAGQGDITIEFHGISPGLDDAIAEIHKYRSGVVKDVAV
ncbi:MAG: hypothetical protein ACXWWV_03920 [Candidatus Deferrimicrobiaceae bacterium]